MRIGATVPGVFESWRADLTWLERNLASGVPTFETALRRPYVFDVDDAIWLTPPWGRVAAARAARRAEVVLAGNAYIGEWMEQHAKKVVIVPTAIDTGRFRPAYGGSPDRPFTIVWTGTSWNFRYLAVAVPALRRFLRDRDARLVVVADRPPDELQIDSDRVVFVRWTADSEVEPLRQADVGIMPLSTDPWSLGKCSLKLLQYMACGLPIVASPVGMNADVLSSGPVGLSVTNESEWYGAFDCLERDPHMRKRMGAAGRDVAVERFSVTSVAAQLATHFASALR